MNQVPPLVRVQAFLFIHVQRTCKTEVFRDRAVDGNLYKACGLHRLIMGGGGHV